MDPKDKLGLAEYAQLRARLAQDNVDRDALLAEHGFDEDSWDALDDAWQEQLSRDLDAGGDDVPASLMVYANTFAAAQRDAPGRLLELELFATCTRALQGARDPKLALQKLGVTLTEYLKANQTWSPQLARDPVLAKRFEKALRGLGAG